jgi:Plavaka transposase
VQDESLAPTHMWNSVKKYYCCGDHEERIYDEPNTADTWWAVDVSSSGPWTHHLLTISLKSELPEKDEFPHCYLPLHFWLDKGLVTRRVSKYPMVLCPVWLPRKIRNASGNGGGVLVGYMPIVSFT